MKFEYFYTTKAEGQLEIESLGNFALQTFNDLGESWVLAVRTDYGRTQVLQYGPFIPEINMPCTPTTSTYRRFEFNESKICDIINKQLNDSYHNITQANLIEYDEALKYIKNMKELLIDD